MNEQWILASGSPRRKELFARICGEFRIEESGADETPPQGLGPEALARHLAKKKAECVYARTGGKVVGADTLVALGNEVLGKPKDAADAERMLALLSGKKHTVITGVAVVTDRGALVRSETTEVTFARLTKERIREYVRTGLAMGKAGAYGIQDGYGLVEKYEGDYDNVVGLPLGLLAKMIGEAEDELGL